MVDNDKHMVRVVLYGRMRMKGTLETKYGNQLKDQKIHLNHTGPQEHRGKYKTIPA